VSAYLRLTVTDTLGVWVDGNHAFNPLAKVTRTCWFRVPDDWVVDGALASDRRDRLVDALYAPGWREGHPDGSRYVLLEVDEKVLTEGETRSRPWLGDRAGFYVWTEEDRFREVIPAEL
jgi:hypothetical protein